MNHLRTVGALMLVPALLVVVGCANSKKQAVSILKRYFAAVEALNKNIDKDYSQIDLAALDSIDPRLRGNYASKLDPEILRTAFSELDSSTENEKVFVTQASEQLATILERNHVFVAESQALASMTASSKAGPSLATIARYRGEFEALTQKALDQIDEIRKKNSSF